MLRAYQMGLNLRDLEELEIGDVFDMMTEQANDQEEYNYKATQADFDKFRGG